MGFVDLRHPEWHAFIPEVLLMNVGLSTTLLTTLAGALLTITTFTFSTLMTVMNMYSNSYSPRMVSNFTEKKRINRVLGVFVGGFLYCVLTLFVIGGIYEKQRVVADGISLVYATFCMFHFILFVHEVIRMTSGSNVVQSVYQEALPVIDAQVAKRRRSLSLQTTECERSIKIYALSTGYLNSIDVARIVRHLQGQKGILQIERHLGDYIVKDFHLATLHLTKTGRCRKTNPRNFWTVLPIVLLHRKWHMNKSKKSFATMRLTSLTRRWMRFRMHTTAPTLKGRMLSLPLSRRMRSIARLWKRRHEEGFSLSLKKTRTEWNRCGSFCIWHRA
uniref:DUF2254 family protein n=1 Tax=Ndongobacter massiliensis TaxID=1871025 RepID=UPI0012FEDB3F